MIFQQCEVGIRPTSHFTSKGHYAAPVSKIHQLVEDFDINNKVGQVCLTIVKKLDFKDIKFPVKVRDIHKIERKKTPLELVFLVMTIKKNSQFMYQKM